MVFRFTTSTILALLILSFSTSPVNVPHERETTSGILPNHLPLAAVNGPQRTIVITVQFPDKGNGSSPRQILTMLSNLNNYYNEDSYGTVSFQSGMTPPVSSSWYTLPNAMTYYGADTVSSDNQLVSDSLQAAYNAGVDLSNYKFAIVVHSGDDEAMTHVSSDIHSGRIRPHRSLLPRSRPPPRTAGPLRSNRSNRPGEQLPGLLGNNGPWRMESKQWQPTPT